MVENHPADDELAPNLMSTSVAALKQPTLPERRDALLVHIYPTGASMGRRYTLGTAPQVIGRSEECDLHIDDTSVSRRHARVVLHADGYHAIDLGSTNGTFINDAPVEDCRLEDGDYLRVGNCIYRFLMGGNVEAEYHEEIYRLAIVDALTDLHNKRYLLEMLDRELARCIRHERPLALVMFDIDHFKTINDTLGHLAGDATLRELASCVKTVVRKEELLARYGGEEFVVVLPETPLDGAANAAERIRALVEQHRFEADGERYPVTVSVGVASTHGARALTPAELLQLADDNLYQAKRAGRNCVRA